ncbi:7241_t:CDS:1, partial [Funneliformis geosporum]
MSTHLPPDAGLYKIDNKDTMRICIFIVKDQGRTFTVVCIVATERFLSMIHVSFSPLQPPGSPYARFFGQRNCL